MTLPRKRSTGPTVGRLTTCHKQAARVKNALIGPGVVASAPAVLTVVGVAPSSAIQHLDRAVRLRSTLRRQLLAGGAVPAAAVTFAGLDRHAFTLAAAAGVICATLALGAGI